MSSIEIALSKSLVSRSDSLRVPLTSFFAVLPYDLDDRLDGGLLACLHARSKSSLDQYEPDQSMINQYAPYADKYLNELREQSIESRLLLAPDPKSLCAREFAIMAHSYRLHYFSHALAASMSESVARALSRIKNILVQPVLSTKQADSFHSGYHYVSSPVESIKLSSYLLIQPLAPASKGSVGNSISSLSRTLSYLVPSVKNPTYDQLLQYISTQ